MLAIFCMIVVFSIAVQSTHCASVKANELSSEPNLHQEVKELKAALEVLEAALKHQQIVMDHLQASLNQPSHAVPDEANEELKQAEDIEKKPGTGEQSVHQTSFNELGNLFSNVSQPDPFYGAGDVHFAACSNEGHDHVYSAGSTIIFDSAHYVTPSGAFDTSNYDFHCPTSGHYFFMLTIYFYLKSSENYRGSVHLRDGSHFLMEVSAQTTSGTSYLMASNSMIHYCTSGSRVHAEAETTSRIYGASHKTSFTGFLLH